MAQTTNRAQNGGKNGNQGQNRQAPVHTVKIGRIRASIWQNSSDNGPFFSITLSRIYRENGENGAWKSASSLGRDDLLPACEVLRAAFMYVVSYQQQNNRNGQQVNNEPSDDNDPPPF